MEQVWKTVVNSYYASPEGWFLALGVLVASAILWPWDKTRLDWLDAIPKRRGKAMRRARRNHVERLFMDDIATSIEGRYFNDEYSPEERRELYLKLKKCFPVRDLFPSPELLKKAIDWRLKNQVHSPVTLPDRKEKAPRKRMFEKLEPT